MVFSWFSIVAHAAGASTLDAMIYVWGAFEQNIVTGEMGTMDIFRRIMKWSFECLWSGKWPTRGWRNIKLP